MSVPQRLVRDMGLNLAEFRRSIVAAVLPHEYIVGGRTFTIMHPQGRLRITLGETKARKIAALSIPQTQVEFDFGTLDEGAREAFLERFDRYFHRGGG